MRTSCECTAALRLTMPPAGWPIYLVFLALLGFLFFQFTESYFAFVLTLFSWSVDLGFAAYHVKEHNRRAERAKKLAEQAEKSFMDSLDSKS